MVLTHSTRARALQVPELRAKLGEWGLETKGTKAELLARVDAYLKEQGEVVY